MAVASDRPRIAVQEVPYEPTVPASDLAAVAALLEIGQQLDILPFVSAEPVAVSDIAGALGYPADKVTAYLVALCHAGLLERLPGGPTRFRTLPGFETWRHQAGFVSWAMNANRPFVMHAREYFLDGPAARKRHPRNGRDIAVSSQWIGSRGFYPDTLAKIIGLRPRRFVDLGAGTARLLIEVLRAVDGSTGVALDIDGGACAEARRAASRANLQDRLLVVERPIQSLADAPEILDGADVVHAGFVLHDLMPDEEAIADRIFASCHERMAPGGVVAITDAAPYVPYESERRFSALMTYVHHACMGRRLLTEAEWEAKLRAAGFEHVEVTPHRLPSGRLITGTKR